MYMTYYGPGEPLSLAFDDYQGIDIISASRTALVLRNPISGVVTTITGTNLPTSYAELEQPVPPGTITGWSSVTSSGANLFQVRGISWTAAEFLNALNQAFNYDELSPLFTLLNRQSITFDAANASAGSGELPGFLGALSTGLTLIASPGLDQMATGYGNDTITLTANSSNVADEFWASSGNDRYTFAPSNTGSIDMTYYDLGFSISVVLGSNGQGQVTKSNGGGQDQLVNWTQTASLGIWGSAGNDSFTINGPANSWVAINGGEGVDSYNITLSGDVRLLLGNSWGRGGTQGVRVNLAEGRIYNDGFGNSETLTVTNGAGRLEIDTRSYADHLTGSAADESFRLRGGNDTVDGGAGFDRVRFDHYNHNTAITVDMAQGRVTGQYNGQGFTTQLSNIEHIRGTAHNDVMTAGAQGMRFDGEAGNDRLVGGTGHDSLYGGAGNDTLNGGAGDDFIYGGTSDSDLRDMIYGGTGNDFIDASGGNDEAHGGAGHDTINGGAGADTLIGNEGNDVIDGGVGADALFGNEGNDTLNGGFAHDRLNGGAGADVFVHMGVLGHGSDWIQDYNAAAGDVLNLVLAGARADQLQVNFAQTTGAGGAAAEAFVIYRPTGQILWALVDGGAQDQINVRIAGITYDLVA